MLYPFGTQAIRSDLWTTDPEYLDKLVEILETEQGINTFSHIARAD